MDKIRDRLWEKAWRERIPLTGAFELLPVCNLSCRMCYVRKSMDEVRQAGGLLDGDTWLDFARQAGERGLLYPLLTGGEPFLHPDFRRILTGMQELGMQVSINTNGTMIDRETAAWLGKHRPCRVNITLYGACAEDYKRLCGNGAAFERVRDAVALCRENGVPLKFNVSITPENCRSLDAIMQYAQEVGVHLDVAAYMFPPVRRDASMAGRNDRLSPEDAAQFQMEMNRRYATETQQALDRERYRRFTAPSKTAPGSKQLKISCRAGSSSFWIDWQGNLSGCGIYSPIAFSLKELSFAEGWERLVDETNRLRYSPACADCPNQPICSPCIAKVYSECGTADGLPEYLCRMHAAVADYYRRLENEPERSDA